NPGCREGSGGAQEFRRAGLKRGFVAVMKTRLIAVGCAVSLSLVAQSIDVKKTETYRRIKARLDATPADTHDHIPPFDLIRGRVETERGFGMTLHALWQSSYYTWFNPLTPWPKSGKFDDWWASAKRDFDNARATSFYRYQLSAF